MVKTTAAAERKATKQAFAVQAQYEKEAFQATLPLKILNLMARAQERGDVRTSVSNSADGEGLSVEFTFKASTGTDYTRGEVLRLTSEEWQLSSVEDEFTRLEAADLERQRIRKVAQTAFDKLTPEEREALGARVPF